MRGERQGAFFGLTVSAMVLVGVALVFCAAASIVGWSLYSRSLRAGVTPTRLLWATTPSQTVDRPAETDASPPASWTPSSTTRSTELLPGPTRTMTPSPTTTRRATITLTTIGDRPTATTTTIATLATPSPAPATWTATPIPDETVVPSETASPTPEPSPTLTPVAATFAPTATPTPTETPLSPGWYVRNDSAYTTDDGDAYVIGEVLNNSGDSQEDVEVTIKFYDPAGREAGEASAFPVVIVVPHGVTIPFEVTHRLTVDFEEYEAQVLSVSASQEVRQDLELVSHSGAAGEEYTIVGEVGNPGPDLPQNGCAWIIATLYDGGGKVAGMGYDGIESANLRAGQVSAFEVVIDDPLPGVVRYALVVLGYPDC